MHSSLQQRVVGLICVTALVVIITCISCQDNLSDSPTSTHPPKAATTAPAKAEDANTTGEELLDANPFAGCDMCHIDVVDELAGSRHEAEGVGCIKCHGPSRGHIRDENNEVKPDTVFARKDIDLFCVGCHKCSRPEAAEPSSKTQSGQKVCTDCHGVHKISL